MNDFLCDQLTKEDAKTAFNALFLGVHGESLSLEERSSRNMTSTEYVYGEATFHGFSSLLDSLDIPVGSTFLDLGSGTGKALAISYLTQPFSKVIGIEYLENISDTATHLMNALSHALKKISAPTAQSWEIIRGDIFVDPLPLAQVIYIASTCFSDRQMLTLSKRLALYDSGTTVISLSKNIEHIKIAYLKSEPLECSWGTSVAHLYQII